MSEIGAAWRAQGIAPIASAPAPPMSTPRRRGRLYLAFAIVGACLGVPALADAQRVDVDLLIYHAEVHPETGEPCGGAFAGPGLTDLNIFFDNIEFNARDEQERWPERAFPRIEPGDGGRLQVALDWSPGNLQFNIPPGLQSSYAVRIGWTDRDVISSDRQVNLDAHRIVTPQRHYITRNGWTTANPGNDYSRHGVIVCNRPPATITTTNIFQDLDPGSVFMGWRHTGGLGEAHDWSRVEVFLEPQPELPQFGRPVYTQAAWGLTNTTVRDLDCGRYFACFRSVDDYGHVWEGCDGEVVVDRCMMDEPDMAMPDMAVVDMAMLDMDPVDMAVDAAPDMAVDAAPDMAVDAAPDMAVDAAPDMAVFIPDMAPAPDMMPIAPDMAPPILDMAPAPDMMPIAPDMAPPILDMAPPILDMAPAPDMMPIAPDMAPPMPDMAPPMPDMMIATPDATLIPIDMTVTPDATPTPIDMASPVVDAAVDAEVDMAPSDPQPDAEPSTPPDMTPNADMAALRDAAEGDPQPEAGANTDAMTSTDADTTDAGADDGDCRAVPGTSGSNWGWVVLALIGLRRRRR